MQEVQKGRGMKAKVGLLLVSGAALVLSVQSGWARPYVSFGLNFATEDIGASTSGINHPTRCDRLLYSDPSSAPRDEACTDDTVRTLLSDSFDLGGSFNGSASLGYAWDRVRVEGEFLSRTHDGDVAYLGAVVDNPALEGKATEWSAYDPPYHRVSEFRSSQLFLNVFYEFGTGSAWSPYVGAGAGLARVRTRYRASFIRRTLADGYVEAVGGDPAQPEDWQAAAAGSASINDTQLSDEVFGYQVIAGVERGLADSASVFLSVRWSGMDDVSGDDVWDTIRSHPPVQADGVTPFTSTQVLEDIGGVSATVGVRYEF